jgi:hypothetical protein
LSSNTNIGNTPVNQGYVQLIHTGETGGIDGTLRTLYDGDGTASDLQIASNKVKVSTELYIGSKTATEFIQDIVGDMFTTGSYTNITTTYDDTNGNIDLNASGDVTLSNTVTLSNKTLAAPTLTGTTQGASITLSGDLTVNGTTTTVNQTNLDVSDNIIGLNRGAGSNANDSGLIIERGSTGDNAAIIWDESADKFTLGTTTSTPSATGDLTISTGTLVANVEGNVSGNLTTDSVTISTIQTGSESFADNDTSLMTSAAIQDKILSYGYTTTGAITALNNATANELVTVGSTTTELDAEANLTFDGTDLAIAATGKIYLDGSNNQTYLVESSNDVLDIYAGGTNMLRLEESGTDYVQVFDNVRLSVGTGKDLQLSHNATNSYIQNYTGDLYFQNHTTDGDIHFLVDDGGGGVENYMQIDGSAGRTLFNKHIRVNDSVEVQVGSSADLQFHHNGSHNYIDINNGNLYFRDDADNNILIVYREGGGIQLSEGDLKIPATSKLYLDGGSDTYITESSADVLKIFVGNEAKLEIDEGNENIFLNTNNLTFRTPGFSAQSKFDILNNKLGIGTTSPGAFLDVHKDNDNSGNQFRVADTEGGSAAVRTYSTSDGTGLILNHYYAVGGSPYMRYSDFVSSMGDGAATTMRFLTKPLNSNPAVAMVIDNSQNVGIGTSSPVAKLDIENTTAPTLDNDTHAGEALFLRSGGSGGDGNVQAVLAFGKADSSSRRSGSAIASVQTDSDADKVGVGFYTSDSSASSQTMDLRMLLNHTGNLHVDADVVAFSTSVSDEKLKDNVKTISNPLDKVMALRGVEFDWNKGNRKGQKDLGLIAQEVEKVLPEIVREKKMAFIDNETYKTIDYDKVVGLLIEAIKEQQQQIEELKNG